MFRVAAGQQARGDERAQGGQVLGLRVGGGLLPGPVGLTDVGEGHALGCVGGLEVGQEVGVDARIGLLAPVLRMQPLQAPAVHAVTEDGVHDLLPARPGGDPEGRAGVRTL